MARIVLITGGCRSGKSAYAQQLAESLAGRRALVATCPVIDDEMARRIEAHRRDREGRGWETIEEPLDLAGALAGAAEFDVLLVDCITLWVNNLMYQAEQQGQILQEPEAAAACDRMLDSACARPGAVIFVTNEIGLGVVPENAQARRFRDLVGRVNQRIAARARQVTLLASGIPLPLKSE